MASCSFRLADYDVSPITGFLPTEAPAPLGGEYFSQWERVVQDLPQFIKAKTLRDEVDALSELEFSDSTLTSEGEWIRAYVILSFLGQGYIWMNGKEDLVHTVPKKLAVPWAAVSDRLGVQPVINYAASVLYNYRLKTPAKPMHLDNLCTLLSFTGSEDESWFFMVHAATEVAAGPGLDAMVNTFDYMNADDHTSICKSLKVVRSSIDNMKSKVQQMIKGCNPQIFYDIIRPFVSGSKNVDALPDGLLYEGVDTKHREYRGASAAQTSSVYAFDMFLGTKHSGEEQSEFVIEMRSYMPRAHREFLGKLDRMPSIREYCKNSGNPDLIACFNEAVEALLNFRVLHHGIVTTYVLKPSGYKEKTGTGGSKLGIFLDGVIEDTKALKL